MALSLPPSPDPRPNNTPIEERENLFPERNVSFSAFTPRPETRLAIQKSPTTDTKISINHRLRTFREESTIIYPLTSYQTWVDAGRLEPLVLPQPDPQYNANVWRHFSSRAGSNYNPEGRGISSLVASMYPLNIPPPSRMGEFTYARFIKNGDIYRDPLRRSKKITATKSELKEMKFLGVLTDARVPPTDEKGRIIAPLAFRRLRAQGRIKHLPLSLDNKYNKNPPQRDTSSINLKYEKHSDTASLASRNTSLRHKGLLWKFSYKMNNPEYDKVLQGQKEKERWRESNSRKRELRKQAIQQELLTGY